MDPTPTTRLSESPQDNTSSIDKFTKAGIKVRDFALGRYTVDLAFHHSPLDGIRGVEPKVPAEETPIPPTYGRGANHSSIRHA